MYDDHHGSSDLDGAFLSRIGELRFASLGMCKSPIESRVLSLIGVANTQTDTALSVPLPAVRGGWILLHIRSRVASGRLWFTGTV